MYSHTVLTKAGCQTTAARRPSALMKNGYVRYVQFDAISSKRYTYFYFLPISPHNHLRNCLVVVRVLNILCLPVQSLTSRMARLDGYCRMHGLSIDNIDRCIRDKEKKNFFVFSLGFYDIYKMPFVFVIPLYLQQIIEETLSTGQRYPGRRGGHRYTVATEDARKSFVEELYGCKESYQQ